MNHPNMTNGDTYAQKQRHHIDADRPQSMLETLARLQEQLIPLYANNVQELLSMADKLLGPAPSDGTKSGEINKGSGAIGKLGDQIETLSQIQIRLAHAIERLRMVV